MAAFAVLGLCASAAPSLAQTTMCYLSNPFPVAPADPWQSQPGIGGNPYFGSSRNGGQRLHTGLDFHMPMNANVPIQHGSPVAGGQAQACNILGGPESPIRNMGGYGRVMFFDCGGGVKVMYSHLNGYNANTKMAINGDTGNARGTAPHVHYEVIIDGQQVDPMCALGLAPPSSYEPRAMRAGACPASLPPGPANLCDPNIRNILKQDGASKGGKAGKDPGGTSYRPEDHQSGIYGSPDEQYDIPYPGGSGPEFEGEGDYNLESTQGTQIITGGQGDPGDPGGVITPGEDNPPASIPPLSSTNDDQNATSCAVDTWVAMTNQSVMEARRETAMQRRFIAKADSVVEYSCMAMYLKKTENEVAGIFSETDLWVNRNVDIIGKTVMMNKTLGAQSMDSALINVVWAAHEEYKKNFSHALMGGLEGYSEQPNGEACADMQKVWDAARCQSFPGPTEAFPRFTDLISNDPRKFPGRTCNNTGINQGMIDAAKNMATRYDKVSPKLDYLEAPEGECKAPIPTGAVVHVLVLPNRDSIEHKMGKIRNNLKDRRYVYRSELEDVFRDPAFRGVATDDSRQIVMDMLNALHVDVVDEGERDGEKIDLLSGSDDIGRTKSYMDAICPNAGCYYRNTAKDGLGECVKMDDPEADAEPDNVNTGNDDNRYLNAPTSRDSGR